MGIFDKEKLQAYIQKTIQYQSDEEDLDYDKLDTALKSIGIQLKDVNGQFRSLDDILLELSEKWTILGDNEKIFIVPKEDKPIKIVFKGEPINEDEATLKFQNFYRRI